MLAVLDVYKRQPKYFDDYNNGRDTVKDPSYTFFEEV